MAKIKTILNTSTPVAALSSTTLNPEVVSSAEQAKLQQLSGQLNDELARHDKLLAEKNRAQFKADEAKYNQGLSFGRLIGSLATGVSEAMEGIYKVQEKQEELALEQTEDLFLINSTVDMQESVLDYINNVNPAASPNEVNLFLQDKQKEILSRAPSESSRIDAFKNTSTIRLQELGRSFRRRNAQLKEQGLNSAQASIGALTNQAYMDPENADTYMAQIQGLQNPLSRITGDTAFTRSILENGQSTIFGAAIRGELRLGQVERAANLLTSESASTLLNNQEFTKTAVNVIEAEKKKVATNLNNLAELNLLKQAQAGIIDVSDNQKNKLSNAVYDKTMASFLDPQGRPIEGITSEDLQQAGVALYLKYPHLPLAPTHKKNTRKWCT